LWSLLLINKDPNRVYGVRMRFETPGGRSNAGFTGALDIYQYSPAQYALNDDKDDPFPLRADSPVHLAPNQATKVVELPAYSITVVRGPGPMADRSELAITLRFQRDLDS
jgi:hypothetical protein